MRHGQNILLGESYGHLEVLDTINSLITHSHWFEEGCHIYDILAKDDGGTHYLLACYRGIIKTTQAGQLVNHYYKGVWIRCMNHLPDSLYLVGLYNARELVVWDERTNTQLVTICDDRLVCSIKRVGITCNYIIKSESEGVTSLTINNIHKADQISVTHLL